jgi:hypothetical protein
MYIGIFFCRVMVTKNHGYHSLPYMKTKQNIQETFGIRQYKYLLGLTMIMFKSIFQGAYTVKGTRGKVSLDSQNDK